MPFTAFPPGPQQTTEAVTLPLLARLPEVLCRANADFVALASRAIRAATFYRIDPAAADLLHPPADDRDAMDRLIERGDFTPRGAFTWLEGMLDEVPCGMLIGFGPLPDGDLYGRGFLIVQHGAEVAMLGDVRWRIRPNGRLVNKSIACIVDAGLADRPGAVDLMGAFCWPLICSFALANLHLAQLTITPSPLAPSQAAALADAFGERPDGWTVNTLGIRRGRAAA